MTQYEVRHCTHCGTPLAWITQAEDGGDKARLRCPACGWTHWNNPTPVLAAIVEVGGQVLLARNAAWPEKMFALITGFMEAGQSPQEGIARQQHLAVNFNNRGQHGRGVVPVGPAAGGAAQALLVATVFGQGDGLQRGRPVGAKTDFVVHMLSFM